MSTFVKLIIEKGSALLNLDKILPSAHSKDHTLNLNTDNYEIFSEAKVKISSSKFNYKSLTVKFLVREIDSKIIEPFHCKLTVFYRLTSPRNKTKIMKHIISRKVFSKFFF